MNNSIVTMSKVVKDNKSYYNIYLFGVLVKNVNDKEYMKLYYSTKEYCRSNNLDIPTYDKSKKSEKDETRSNK